MTLCASGRQTAGFCPIMGCSTLIIVGRAVCKI